MIPLLLYAAAVLALVAVLVVLLKPRSHPPSAFETRERANRRYRQPRN